MKAPDSFCFNPITPEISRVLQEHLTKVLGAAWSGGINADFVLFPRIFCEKWRGEWKFTYASVPDYLPEGVGTKVLTIEQVLSISREPKSVSVKLNDEYTAIVSRNGIKVGCQTFPLSTVPRLADAVKEVTKEA